MASSVEKSVSNETVRDLMVAVNQYELFIGWVGEVARNGVKNKNMVPRLVLKQIMGRVENPVCTQLEKARAYAVEFLTDQVTCPMFTKDEEQGSECIGSGWKACANCSRKVSVSPGQKR